MYQVLADPTRPSILCWHRKWSFRLNFRSCHTAILSEKAHDSYWHCCHREQYRYVSLWVFRLKDSFTIAGILYPIMERRLFVSLGFPWAVRTLAFLMLACLLPCIAIMRLRPNMSRRGPLFAPKHFRDVPYTSFCLGAYQVLHVPVSTATNFHTELCSGFALMIASVYIPFFFIEEYGLRLGLDIDISFYLLSIMNAASLFGRLAPNWLADK